MLPSVVEDNASLVNDFRVCLVDATCFRLALFSSCSHNYACCQCREREGAPQHCAMPINKVVKGHLWRHSHSPEGDSASVSRAHKGLKCVCAVGHGKAWNERHLLCDVRLDFGSTDRFCKQSQLPNTLRKSPFIFCCALWLVVITSQITQRNIKYQANPENLLFAHSEAPSVPSLIASSHNAEK